MKIRNNKNMKNKNIKNNKNWKVNGQEYLRELQAFLDKAENIENEELRKEIIFQMLKCDKELTSLAESIFEKYEGNIERKIKDYSEYEDD